MEDFVYESNMEYVASLGPTLAYLVLLMVVGLVGNSLVFLVYYKRFKPSVTRTYILAMSVCDLMTNSLALPSDIYEIRFHFDFDDDAGCKFFGYITRFLALQGALILIAIAVDRRRKICQSMKKPRTPKHVYVELVCLGVFAACYSVPFGVLRGLQTIPVENFNVSGTTCSIDDAYVGSLFFVIYNASMGLAFIICVTIMAVCYSLIARHLWLHKKRLLHNAKRRQNQARDQDSRDKGTNDPTDPDHNQPAIHNNELSEDEGNYQASTGQLQISITEDSDVASDLENTASYHLHTSGVVSSSLTNISETEISAQQETGSFSGEASVEDINPGASGSAAQKGIPRLAVTTLREVAMVTNASKSHANSPSTSRGPKALKTKKHCGKNPNLAKPSKKKIPGRTTLMMFVLAAMYVVSYLPYLFMAAMFRGKDLVGVDFWVWNLSQIALRSFFINSAVNPLVYSFCSIKFRRECYLFLCRK